MSMMILAHSETPAKDAVVDATTRFECGYRNWINVSYITIMSRITTVAAGAGDSIVIQPQTRVNPEYDWVDLGSPFPAVVGNATIPNQFSAAYHKPNLGWHGEISFLVTIAGGTAEFTLTLTIEGSNQ